MGAHRFVCSLLLATSGSTEAMCRSMTSTTRRFCDLLYRLICGGQCSKECTSALSRSPTTASPEMTLSPQPQRRAWHHHTSHRRKHGDKVMLPEQVISDCDWMLQIPILLSSEVLSCATCRFFLVDAPLPSPEPTSSPFPTSMSPGPPTRHACARNQTEQIAARPRPRSSTIRLEIFLSSALD
ncbi:hypothetical protein CC79DRAFT_1132687 [Sarocladium strictum]